MTAERDAFPRTGGPIDDEADVDLVDVWAGVVPVRAAFGEPEPDDLADAVPAPPSVVDYRR